MTLAYALSRIIDEYPSAKGETFSGHMLGTVIRDAARHEVADALGSGNEDLLVRGSAGQGIWAEVPWISVFDPLVTRTATQGYYVVYLILARVITVCMREAHWGPEALDQRFQEGLLTRVLDRATALLAEHH